MLCVRLSYQLYVGKKERKTTRNQLGAGESKQKVSVYQLPKTEEERERWIKVIPDANLKVTNNTDFNLHWPQYFEKIEKNGKIRPKNPVYLAWDSF